MKTTFLFCLGLLLTTSLFISCSDDDDNDNPPLPYIVAPKANVEFEGATLNTVKDALQGTWWVKNLLDREYEEGTMWFLAIKGDKMITYGGNAVDYGKEPEWRNMKWIERRTEDGGIIYSFYPEIEGFESGFVPYTPIQIKDHVLMMEHAANENIYYGLVTEK